MDLDLLDKFYEVLNPGCFQRARDLDPKVHHVIGPMPFLHTLVWRIQEFIDYRGQYSFFYMYVCKANIFEMKEVSMSVHPVYFETG